MLPKGMFIWEPRLAIKPYSQINIVPSKQQDMSPALEDMGLAAGSVEGKQGRR